MKLTKTSRVTAMILALLMIVPLISVPTFAEDAATNIIKSLANESFDDSSIVNTQAQKYMVNGTNVIQGVSFVDGSATGKNVSDKVLEINFDGADSTATSPTNKGFWVTQDRAAITANSPVYSYDPNNANKVLVLQEDLYIPEGTAFQVTASLKNFFIPKTPVVKTETKTDSEGKTYTVTTTTTDMDADRNKVVEVVIMDNDTNAFVESFVDSEGNTISSYKTTTEVTTANNTYWVALWQLTSTNGTSKPQLRTVSSSNVAGSWGNGPYFEFNTWYTVTTVLNFDSGLVSIYTNGTLSYSYNLKHANAGVALTKMHFTGIVPFKLTANDTNNKYSGTVYCDNINVNIYDNGYVPSTPATPTLYSADYAATADGITAKLGTETLYTLENGLLNVDGAKTPLTADAANNVKIVLGTLASGKLTADIYLNGIYAGTRDLAATTVGDWDLGTAVATETYDATALKETALAEDVIYATYNNVNYPNIANVFRTYGLTDPAYTKTTAAEYFAEHALINTLEASSMRLTDPTGLRFATEVNMDEVNALAALGITIKEIGTLISPADYAAKFDGAMPNLEDYVPKDLGDGTMQTTILKVVAGAACLDGVVDNDETTTHIVGSIIGILAGNIGRDFNGRGYITVVLANGTEINLYSATTHTIDVQDQAGKTLAEHKAGTITIANADKYVPILEAYAAGNDPYAETTDAQ